MLTPPLPLTLLLQSHVRIYELVKRQSLVSFLIHLSIFFALRWGLTLAWNLTKSLIFASKPPDPPVSTFQRLRLEALVITSEFLSFKYGSGE